MESQDQNGVRWAEYEVVKILDSFLKKFRNFSQIDKKMKIKVDENLFSAIISVMTKVSRRNIRGTFFVLFCQLDLLSGHTDKNRLKHDTF